MVWGQALLARGAWQLPPTTALARRKLVVSALADDDMESKDPLETNLKQDGLWNLEKRVERLEVQSQASLGTWRGESYTELRQFGRSEDGLQSSLYESNRRLERLEDRVQKNSSELDVQFGKLKGELDGRFDRLENRVQTISSELNGGIGKLEGELDGRFHRLEDRVQTRIGKLEGELNGRIGKLEGELDKRFERLEGELDRRWEKLDLRLQTSQDSFNKDFRIVQGVLIAFVVLSVAYKVPGVG